MRVSLTRLIQVATTGLLVVGVLAVIARGHGEESKTAYNNTGGTVGYVNKRGDFVIKPQYTNGNRFSEGVAAVFDHGCLRFIRKDGTPAFKKRFFLAMSPNSSEWLYGVQSGEASRYCQFSAGLCPVPDVSPFGGSAQWGYIDGTGEFVIKPSFDKAGPFWQGRALVQAEGGDRYFIDRTGKRLPCCVPAESFEFVPAGFGGAAAEPWFASGLTPMVSHYKTGYVNAAGVCVIKPKFSSGKEFSEGLAAVDETQENSKRNTFFIDNTGKQAFSDKYENAGSFREGLAPVKINGKWGFIDHQGKQVIPARFEETCEFCDGLACVQLNSLYGCIDKTGKMVIAPRFKDHVHFSDGLASTTVVQPPFSGFACHGF